MNKYISFSLLLFINLLIFSEESGTHFLLPVKVLNAKKTGIVDLKKENITLFINGENREILNVIKFQESMGQKSILKKSIILSFHTQKCSENHKRAISYLITEILVPGDTVIVLSPLQNYKLEVSPNKVKVIEEIVDRVERDCSSYGRSRFKLEKRIELLYQEFYQYTREYSAYKVARQYFTNFMRVLNLLSRKLENHFLFPYLKNYFRVEDYLKTQEANVWWIHFQDRSMDPIPLSLRHLIRRVAYIFILQLGSKEFDLNSIEKTDFIVRLFPAKELLDLIIDNIISFNVIYELASQENSHKSKKKSVIHLDQMLNKMVLYSGGKILRSADFEEAIGEISAHSHQYYQVKYLFNGQFEDKNIHLESHKKGIGLVYGVKQSKVKVESMIRYLTKEKIRITNFLLTDSHVTFFIKNYSLDQKGECGIINVAISLIGEGGVVAYHRAKTLRATKDEVTVSIPIPKRASGSFRVKVSAYDLIANNSTSIHQKIQL